MGRWIGAVVAGFILWTVMWLAGGAMFRLGFADAFAPDGTTDSAGLLIAILVLSVICSLAAGYLTAHIAREWARRATLVLAVVLLLVGVVVQAQVWDAMPLWYHLVFLVLLVPMTLLGARLRNRAAKAVEIGK